MINKLGREIPEYIEGLGKLKPFMGVNKGQMDCTKAPVKVRHKSNTEKKLLSSVKEALLAVEIKDGMTISFHHHLRNGDYVLNMVLEAAEELGIKDLTVAASSIFPVHAPMVKLIEDGTVTGIYAAYMSGPVAEAVSEGMLKKPVVMQTHGGRARAIESGDLHIDIAFIAAPTSDEYGNINGVYGKSACGVLGYAVADSEYADKVVAITDNLVPYPACPIEINETHVDYVVKVDSIGNPEGIVSGTTKITKDPVGLKIASLTAKVMEASGLVKDGMSFQTGAGGTSLAVADKLKEIMVRDGIKGSFAAGGITGYIVDMKEQGLFDNLFDVQCFDLKAIESFKKDKSHMAMSASMYGNPFNKGTVADKLDFMILGATEIDVDFNVNVLTASDGKIMGGSGGHSDTAAGAKVAIVVTNLIKARLPIVREKVTTVTTPGESIDILVTERGIAVNPLRQDLLKKLLDAKLPIVNVKDLKSMAEGLTGKPKELSKSGKIIGVVEYRDGTIIDTIERSGC